MVEVLITDTCRDWYVGLNEEESGKVFEAVEQLKLLGVTLGFPYSSAIRGSRFPLRELRIKSGRHQLRVLYAFDRERQAVLLLGGDKTGDDRFYEWAIPAAEKEWEDYVAEIDENSS